MKLISSNGTLNYKAIPSKFVLMLILIFITVWSIGPLYWIFITGLKNSTEVYWYPPSLYPTKSTLQNLKYIFTERPFAFYLRNSSIVAVSTVLLSTTLATLAGYGFAKFQFRGKSIWLILILLTRTVPPASLLVPFYIMGRKLGLINTHFILIAGYVYLTLPLNIWIIIGFFQQFPDELIDAAEIDGCTRIAALFRVVLPSLLPALTAVGIITFMLAWNELLYGVVLINTKAAKTLSPGLTDFFGDFHIFWNQLASAAIVAILPAIAFTIFFSRYLVAGLVRGAIKG
ncbi:MAG: carbohydrate ABC transporter permease [Spirochaetaceae bacterium]|nr:MAG: carbohydrate ABC transporter permease [Spirochaetaceae bacterium]